MMGQMPHHFKYIFFILVGENQPNEEEYSKNYFAGYGFVIGVVLVASLYICE